GPRRALKRQNDLSVGCLAASLRTLEPDAAAIPSAGVVRDGIIVQAEVLSEGFAGSFDGLLSGVPQLIRAGIRHKATRQYSECAEHHPLLAGVARPAVLKTGNGLIAELLGAAANPDFHFVIPDEAQFNVFPSLRTREHAASSGRYRGPVRACPDECLILPMP